MLLAALINFASLPLLLLSIGLLVFCVAVAAIRRPAVPALTRILIGAGLTLLCLAAGGVRVDRPAKGEITVMVDLSASTRGASYRDGARLRQRIEQLVGTIPYRVIFFSEAVAPEHEITSGPLADLPGGKTIFSPPAVGPVLLFTDGQFSIPPNITAATYIVVDPALESVTDASVRSIDFRGKDAAVRIANSGSPRRVAITGVVSATNEADIAPTGTIVFARALAGGLKVSATLATGGDNHDAWPENDSITAIVPPPQKAQHWWIGASEPDANWRRIDPHDFPIDPAALLTPAVIVLNNVPATDLILQQQERLRQYVRDFGGGLIILGGDRAFAAGGYPGSVLEALSPLASSPPDPVTHWMLLADSSGSMNSDVGNGSSRWSVAIDALAKVIPAIPAADRVSIGGFAQDLRWWVSDAAAKDVSPGRFPPTGTAPRGPTMLTDALQAVAKTAADSKLPSQLLLMTDAGADVADPASIAAVFQSKQIRLNVLVTGEESGSGLAALRQIARETNGRVMLELDPLKWTAAMCQLMRAAMPDLLRRDALTVNFSDTLKDLPPARSESWNRVWLKESATPLAQALAGTDRLVPVARSADDQRVLAAAFSPSVEQLNAFVKLVERPPHDPRFTVTWDVGRKTRVTVDAIDEKGQYLNHQSISATWLNHDRGIDESKRNLLSQIAPGRYEWTMDAPREPGVVELNFEGGSAEYHSIPGRYPAEFDSVGNERHVMVELAERSGGRVIEPSDAQAIDFQWPTKQTPMSSLLASIGAALIAAGLIVWRVS